MSEQTPGESLRKDSGFISFPVRRPIMTTVIFLIVVIIGLFSLTRLPIDLMPEITMPTVTVVTTYDNAGPLEVEELVTRPIESALSALQGIEEITSTSTEGRSTVRVTFPWGTDQEAAINDMRDRLDRILGRLPDEVARPMIRKFDISAMPILLLGVMGGDKDLAMIQQLLEDQVQYRLERVPGVATVDIRGGRKRQIQVALRAASMEAYGMSTDMVVAALRRENRNIPAGSVVAGNRDVMVRTLAEYSNVNDVSSTVITVKDGVPVRISDVADVFDGLEEQTSMERINGERGIRLAIAKQTGTNTVAVAQAVQREVRRINQDIDGLEIITLIDNAVYVERAMMSVTQALLLGGMIAIFVILLFLRNVTSTVIIGMAVPISVIATFALVYFCGFSLNMMTFGGLALGIGMLLDNSIVVLDNIYHKRENGVNPYDAAVKGTKEVCSAIIASTVTTLVVFIPVIFMRGMSGIMYQSLAYVVAFSLLCSLFVAMTLVPMMSSRYLNPKKSKQENKGKGIAGKVFDTSEKFYLVLERRYRKILNWSLHNRLTVVSFIFLLFACSILMLPMVGVDLMPAADESDVVINIEMEIGTKLDRLDETVFKIEEIVRAEVPEMRNMLSNIASSPGFQAVGGNTARVRTWLVPPKERSRSSVQVANDLREKLRGIPGATIRVREGQGLFIMRMGTNTDQAVGIEIRGYDLKIGQDLANQISTAVADVPGVTDVRISREAGQPEFRVKIDRNKAAELGLSATQIGSTVQTAMGGTAATKVRVEGKEFDVIVRLAEEDRRGLDNINNLSVINSSGQPIALQSAARLESGQGPVRVERRDRERIVNVSVNYVDRDMGSVVEDLRAALREISIPQEFAVLIRGDWEEQQKAQREMIMAIVMAIILIFLVMAGQFESFKDPFIVIFSIPVSLIGVVAIMMATGTPFTIQAFIGLLILVGISINNAIVLVDLVNRLRREENIELFEALKIAGERRLRPILMTSFSTILGLLPMAIGLGEGSEAQVPMARVVIGGLVTSTLITLVLIPVIYSLVEQKLGKKRKVSSQGAL
ncbi:MAG: efflux RND transporter permease subunit [Chitinispirillia bacterium]|nr:efflux RND transporter permease subunit [Chitinispirillia bacterium]